MTAEPAGSLGCTRTLCGSLTARESSPRPRCGSLEPEEAISPDVLGSLAIGAVKVR
jgi:hypothetical protein